MNKEISKKRFHDLKVCVVIPTYNNADTLVEVINGVKQYTDSILVINDGCTDHTAEILAEVPEVEIVSHEVNKGKGIALQTGFRAAAEKGFEYAITIDSDGQHYAEDLIAFLDTVAENPGAVIVGARNMGQSSVPGKSSVGYKVSNFWFWVITEISLPDTQSGYRLYPVQRIKDFRWLTNKYEFEIEVLVRAAWADIPVLSVPVKVFYPPKEERISHFRPFEDFSRIFILNTVFVILSVLFIKPRKILRLFQKKNLSRFVKKNFLNEDEKNSIKIASIAFGVFMGIFPVWGFQLMVGIPLSHLFRLNKALFILAANISIPPMIPVIIFLSHWTGGMVLNKPTHLLFDKTISMETVKNELLQY
jgi:glycosyltransferase involved in cell wall biosynthesis